MNDQLLWDEVHRLRADLENLKVKRDTLTAHLTELKTLTAQLEQAHNRTHSMAAELEQVLTDRAEGE